MNDFGVGYSADLLSLSNEFELVQDSTQLDDEQPPSFRGLAWRTIISSAVLILSVLAAGFFLRDPVTALAVRAIDTLGLIGVFFGVFASDSLGFPVPPSTYLFAAVAAETPVLAILLISSAGSILGGTIAYKLGPYIGRLPLLNRLLDRFRSRGERLFQNWGIWAVGIAAVTPLPFAVSCWLAGIYKMPFARFFTATLVRAPRFAAYYGFFTIGWAGSAMI